jgi:translation elongation factor EF-G
MRSSTQGRAEYSMHFARYEEAPRSVAEEIIAKVQGTAKWRKRRRFGFELEARS